MEKYAVQTETKENTKIAYDKNICINCSSMLDRNSNVPKCPKCGTEFTESRK